MDSYTAVRTTNGYVPLERGAQVEFAKPIRGWVGGKVVSVHLNPNRAPGEGRVSYLVKVHPAVRDVLVPAKNVRRV